MDKSKMKLAIAIFAISFLAMGVGTTSPALASIGQAFPDVDFSMILLVATLPALFMVPFSILGGKLAGTVMKFKTLVIIGTTLFLFGGTAPYFMNSFTGILVMRAIVGVGLGIMSPIAPALIMNLFEGKIRENLMGINGIVTNIGGIVFQMLGGILCAVNWRNTFLAHLLAVVSLIIVLFMLPEPPKVEKPGTEKVKMPGMVYGWATIFLFYTVLLYPMLTGMSSLVLANNYGTAAGAGIALTMFTVGGMISGIIFGNVYHAATRFTFVLGLIIHAIGYIFLIYGNSLMLLTVGATIVGIGFGFVMPAVTMSAGMLVPPYATPFAISLVIGFMSIGGFCSGFIFAFIQKTFNITSMRFPFIFGFICLVAYSIIHTLLNLKTPRIQDPSASAGPQ